MDLSVAYNMQEGTLQSLEFEYLNEIAAYMLNALVESQSMGTPTLCSRRCAAAAIFSYICSKFT